MLSVQSKSHTLARMLTNDNVISGQILSNPKFATEENLANINVSSAPIFTNLGAVELLSVNQNATNIDVSSLLMPFNIFQSQGRTGLGSYIAGNPASKKEQYSDLYGDSLLSFETTTRGREFLESIKKRSINKCFAQEVDKKKDSISNSTVSKHLKWDCHYHLDNNADAKIITAAYCQHLKPCYIFLSAAKSADGIGVPVITKATHDAPSVFFCVVGIAQPFFSNADIMRVAYQVMVGCSGAEQSAPVSFVSGYANPEQSTTSEIGVSGGGSNEHTKEAAKWLLPSPQNRHLSGLSPLFAVIVRLSKRLFTISPHLQSAKPVNRSSKITFASLPDALIRRCLMSKVYQSPYDLAEKADTILEVLNVIDGVIAQDCPNQKRTLTALNDLMRLAVHDLYCLLDGCEIRGGENA